MEQPAHCRLQTLLLELRRYLLLFFEPLAEFFVDRVTDLHQAKLDSIEILVKSVLENFVDGDIAKIRQKLAGKAFRLEFVLKIAALDSGDFVEGVVKGINTKEDRSRERLVFDEEFNDRPGFNLAPIMLSVGLKCAA